MIRKMFSAIKVMLAVSRRRSLFVSALSTSETLANCLMRPYVFFEGEDTDEGENVRPSDAFCLAVAFSLTLALSRWEREYAVSTSR